MPYFLIIALSIYVAMHAYLLTKVSLAFPGLGRLRIALGVFLVLMVAMPVLSLFLDRWRHETTAKALGAVAFTWMAIIFWFCAAGLATDAWNLVVRGMALAAPAVKVVLLPARPTLLIIVGLVVCATVWGWFEAERIRPVRHTFTVARLPGGKKSLTIAQITDVHIGVHTGRRRLETIARLIEEARPDVILSTGDLVDSPFVESEALAPLLARLEAPRGKFAVFGNHEFYTGLEEVLPFYERTGFHVLRQQSAEILPGVLLVGVDDPAGGRRNVTCYTDEDAVLPPPGEDRPVVVLAKHQPRVEEASLGRFDVQLSGHTHNGQIFPFMFIVRLFYPRVAGTYDLGKGSSLYVSHGAGTWGPKMRLFSRPEVALITLVTRDAEGRQTSAGE